ncbi:MAG: GLPGLI family protein [Ferruginibacter sp.]|nr:GLPGLI family protein [Ferruginibacter sp.]
MNKKIYFTTVAILFAIHSIAQTDKAYSCKYRYIWQKDASNKDSKFDDVMILTIKNSNTIYYSYLKHFGYRNFETDQKNGIGKSNTTVSGNMVNVNGNSTNSGTYFIKNESEVIKINFFEKKINISDKLLEQVYGYETELEKPLWQIEKDTVTILNQSCQKAITTFKGRNFIAWFANAIPYKYGPWLFNGLPGLILKVEDEKKQFLWECIELNTPNTTTKVFQEYAKIKMISKKELKLKKKFYYEDTIGFMQLENGVTISVTDTKTGNPVQKKQKSYNLIDLTP